MLHWEEVDIGCSRKFLTAKFIGLAIDFSDICQNRFWGNNAFKFNYCFSIHERIMKSNWSYQLLAPSDIHVYCKSIDEAKAIAEVMAKRISGALLERFGKIKGSLRNVKKKREKLIELATFRGLRFRNIWYLGGWHITLLNDVQQLLGSNYEQALDMLNSGAFDFLGEHEEEKSKS